MEKWLKKRGHKVTKTLLYKKNVFPSVNDFDWLIIMGGPMNVYEYDKYPWLAEEKQFIKKSIRSGKTILGVCLGGQLLSDCLGGRVTRNKYIETGFFPVELTGAGKKSVLFSGVKNKFTAMHLHGDTFSIPPGAKHTAKSSGCKNQAFEYKGRVFGIQFHFEYSSGHMKEFFKDPGNSTAPGRYVQSADTIIKSGSGYREIKAVMETVLSNIERTVK
jgi:GMP synthase-like glutamine amidotransferase